MRLPYLAIRTHLPEETKAIGRQVGELARPGEIILLSGELGTGKTTFVKGVAQGLEVPDITRSPSFVIAQVHDGGRYPFLHVDLFRCSTPQEVADLGIQEMLEPPWVVAVEWGEKAFPVVPDDYLEVELSYGDGEDDRMILLRPYGRWQERMRELSDSVRTWSIGGGG